MSVNNYLLLQAATATAVAAPQGLSLGEWLAIISCGLVLFGVVYRAGVAATKADQVEGLVGRELASMSEKIDKISEYMERSDAESRQIAIWRENITGRVVRLEGDSPVFIHKRAGD